MNLTAIFRNICGGAILLITVGYHVSANTDTVKVRVGVFENPPKVYLTDNGGTEGIFIDLLKEIARLENWKLIFIHDIWSAQLDRLDKAEIDILPDLAFTPARSSRYSFNQVTVLESWSQVYVKKNSKIQNLNDLENKRIALLNGAVQTGNFSRLMLSSRLSFEIVHTKTYDEAFSMVSTGVADAVVANNFFGQTNYKKYGLKPLQIVLNPSFLHFAFPWSVNPELAVTIDKYLAKWVSNEESVYYKILARYEVKDELTKTESSVFQWVIVLFVVVFMASVVFLLLRRRIRNITRALFQSDKQLHEQEHKFRSYIQNAPHGILIANEKGRFIEANRTAGILTGYTNDELIKMGLPEIVSPDWHTRAFAHFARVLNEGWAREVLPLITKNNQIRLFSIDAVKISEVRFMAFIIDVTEEKLAQKRLNWVNRIFDQSLNEIYLFNAENLQFIDVNPAAFKNTGYTLGELKKMTPLHLMKNLSEVQFLKMLEPLKLGNNQLLTIEAAHFRKDGSFYEAEIHLQMLEFEDEKMYLSIVIDNTVRKRNEKELYELKLQLEKQVNEKTRELQLRINELEQFMEATIERELRMEELRVEIGNLKSLLNNPTK